jgi:hypothetical protein
MAEHEQSGRVQVRYVATPTAAAQSWQKRWEVIFDPALALLIAAYLGLHTPAVRVAGCTTLQWEPC